MTTTSPQTAWEERAARHAHRGGYRCRVHQGQPVRPDGRGCPHCDRERTESRARRRRGGNPDSRWWEQ